MNESLKDKARKMLTENILPFWANMADEENGGFFGEADFYGNIKRTAPKGGVLNARLLWTFSAACRVLNDDKYRDCAEIAYGAFTYYFHDQKHGGAFWLLDHKMAPLDTKKQFYNLAFSIYGLSEYYRLTKNETALKHAVNLYELIEKHAADPAHGGYIDAKARDFKNLADTSLSGKDLNCAKTMNTNLHILESYTNLFRVYPNEGPKKRLTELAFLILDKIIVDGRFALYFSDDFTPLSKNISFGHDIEGSWLLCEAARASGDGALIERARAVCGNWAGWVLNNGVDKDRGGLLDYPGCAKKAWWPQAEAVVGFLNAYAETGDVAFKNAASDMFAYIENVFVDGGHGEWHNEVFPGNAPDTKMPKADMWKCPYHNGRMCLEIMEAPV